MRNSAKKTLDTLAVHSIIESWNTGRMGGETHHFIKYGDPHHVSISFEVFGRDARMFINCADAEIHGYAVQALDGINATINRNWGPTFAFSVALEYYKGPKHLE